MVVLYELPLKSCSRVIAWVQELASFIDGLLSKPYYRLYLTMLLAQCMQHIDVCESLIICSCSSLPLIVMVEAQNSVKILDVLNEKKYRAKSQIMHKKPDRDRKSLPLHCL